MSDLRERMMKDFRSSGKYPNGSRGWESCLLDRISELEAIIEMLPHGDECLLVFNTITDRWEIETCNCPKSKIGSK